MPKGIEARLTLAVLAYVALQAGLRLLIGRSLELDEAEAFYQARHLAWGYGAQPPLYFWLQWGMFRTFGEGLLALAVLKALILSGTILGLFALLRREAGTGPAAVAALSLSLLPEVVWEGQRALTHTMLALLMAVLATGLFARALGSGRWRDHLLLGLGLGLGTLSKFNFAVWPLGLLLAAAVLPRWRGRLRPLRLLAAAAIAGMVVAPVGLWMLAHPELATGSVRKLDIAQGGGFGARIEGTRDLAMAALTLVAVPVLGLGAFALVWRRGPARTGPMARLVGTASVASVLILWIGLLATGVTEVAVRWLLPLAWGLVPAGASWLWSGMGQGGRRGLAGVIAALWIGVVPLLPYASLVDPGYRGADFAPLIEALRARGAGERPLAVTSQWVAGNLAFQAPDLAPRFLQGGESPAPGAVLVAEDEQNATGANPEVVVVPRGRREARVVVTDVP